MNRGGALLGSFAFLLLAPGTVSGLIPWWISRWQVQRPFLGVVAFRIVGVVLITLGAAALLDSFVRFAVRGLGTPAPVLPTRHLVVTGLYRRVRNPMYVAVVSVILGQALLLGDEKCDRRRLRPVAVDDPARCLDGCGRSRAPGVHAPH